MIGGASKIKPQNLNNMKTNLDQDFNSLSDAAILSLLIGGRDAEYKSLNLTKSVNYNLRELAKMTVNDYQKFGLTKRESKNMTAVFEISKRKQLAEVADKTQIKCSKDVFDILSPSLSDLQHEEFWILFLNRSNKIIKTEKLSQGGISGTVTDIRLLFKSALQCLASGMIVCHNHPSGNITPSEADSKITQKIKEAGNLLDIQLLDHVIICDKNHYSFADNGLL
jgi:DNA repair protein RadC